MKYKPLHLIYFPFAVMLGGSFSFLGAPWWIICIAGFLAAYFFPLSQEKRFLMAFIAGFTLWAGTSFYLDLQNGHMLAQKMGQLLGGTQALQLIVLTGVIGGLLATAGAWLGSIAKK